MQGGDSTNLLVVASYEIYTFSVEGSFVQGYDGVNGQDFLEYITEISPLQNYIVFNDINSSGLVIQRYDYALNTLTNGQNLVVNIVPTCSASIRGSNLLAVGMG